MNDIKVNHFTIHFYGDESVGIFSGSWKLGNEFYFQSKEDLQHFKDKLKEAFSFCADESCIGVFTDEEEQKELEKEEQLWD